VQRFGRDEGRRLFGADPAGYDFARPGHAERVYEVLVERCGLRPGTSVLEVGPGTGQATRRLAAWDASWDTAGIRALYGSFSPILRLDDDSRTDVLDEIARIANQDFGGRVSRAITTALYTCRRPE
jgi:hypothetical protein